MSYPKLKKLKTLTVTTCKVKYPKEKQEVSVRIEYDPETDYEMIEMNVLDTTSGEVATYKHPEEYHHFQEIYDAISLEAFE